MAIKTSTFIGINLINSIVQFGANGVKWIATATGFSAKLEDESTLATVAGADAVSDNDFVTLQQLNTTLTGSRTSYIVSGQIDGGSPPVVVNDAIYIVTTTGTTYTQGELYIGISGSWVKLTTSDGQTIQTTAALTGGALTFDDNSIYLLEDGTTWALKSSNVSSTANLITHFTSTIDFNTASPVTLVTAPAGSTVCDIGFVDVITAFDDAAATISIGIAGDTELLCGTENSILSSTGGNMFRTRHVFASETDIIATLAPGASTTGQVVVSYSLRT